MLTSLITGIKSMLGFTPSPSGPPIRLGIRKSKKFGVNGQRGPMFRRELPSDLEADKAAEDKDTP